MSWINVSDKLPENSSAVLCMSHKGYKFIAQYSRGKDFMNDSKYLPEGWYEAQEQRVEDYYWFTRRVSFWQPLP